MKVFLSSLLVIGTMLAAGTAYSSDRGCRNSRRIMNAVHQLEQDANHFANQVRREDGYSHLYSDATEVAQEADHFHDVIDSGNRCQHIQEDFRGLSQAWRHLTQKWDRAHRSHNNYRLADDFYDLQSSFQHVRRSMRRGGGSGGGHGRGRGRIGGSIGDELDDLG